MSAYGDITYDLTSLTGITKIVWDNGRTGSSTLNDNWWQKLDTISYVAAPSAVPEPGTLALLAVGVLGFAASRRKRAA